jgi:chromosome segregation protein
MHIKKLEICGFKSFVDKTVVHFDHDVIGIVGPNGCGKSNIVDAIRWCMGEQSAKHLRGRAMEDVIFNGSESRPQHGLAEVTLSFDNSDSAYATSLPAEYRDYPELAVTRRLYRDGTSEYLINKTQVRLRDVTDLFLGTGVGTKAYSIVEQGRIGQIVSSRPQDRRLYIEEAAGITKYKLRRKQAERKMDLTRQNLLRVTDIVNEIDRTRNSLKRQAAKAERYIHYREELEDLVLHNSAHRLLEMIVVGKARATGHGVLVQRSAELQMSLDEGEAILASARGEASGIESRYDRATAAAAAADQRVTQLESEVTRAQDRTGHLEQRLAQLETERASLEVRLGAFASEANELEERVGWLNQDEASRGTEAQSEEVDLQRLRTLEQEAESALSRLREKSTTEGAEYASTGAKRDALSQRLTELQLRRTQLAPEHEELTVALAAELAAQAALAESVEAHREIREASAGESDQVESELRSARLELKKSNDELGTLNSQLSHKRSRFNVLTDLHRRLEGVGAGTKALLESEDPAVVGLLADRVEVVETYTEAFASLLGDRLQCVIVRDPARGLELLDELKRNKSGRATIATQRDNVVEGARSVAADDPGVLTRLIDQLRYSAEDEALIKGLVADAVVVASASDAVAVVARHPGTTAVALDGTVVREDGLVSGGAGDDVASAMLEQKREMRQLGEELEAGDVSSAEATSICLALTERVSTLEAQLESTRNALHERELSHIRTEKDLANSTAKLEQAQRQLDRLVKEEAELAAKNDEVSTDLARCSTRLDELDEERRTTAAALDEAQEHAAQRKVEATEKAARATERKVRLAQVREQLDAAKTSLTRIEGERTAAAARLGDVVEEWRAAASALGRAAAEWLLGVEANHDARQTAATAQSELDDIRRLLEQIRSGLGEREGTLRELRVELASVDERSRQSEMNLQKLQLEQQHLVENVAERFRGLDLPRVIGDYHARPAPDAEHRRRIDELTKLIDRMGPVNLDAKTEYEDAETRYADLSVQRDDIQQALDELDRAIRHMDRESRRRFRETFTAVNELFKKTFSRLFKGGRGELIMTDPDNVLETGVDIIAQPPGKKLGNIELMSGGEKALTATALIFAIFQYRPSPFCILDEVDAPLDEANVGRYNEAVRAMTKNSQFVIITHIKSTMQTVDVLYGVTMGEPGVSRVVSVKVNDAAKARSDREERALSAPQKPVTDEATAVA